MPLGAEEVNWMSPIDWSWRTFELLLQRVIRHDALGANKLPKVDLAVPVPVVDVE